MTTLHRKIFPKDASCKRQTVVDPAVDSAPSWYGLLVFTGSSAWTRKKSKFRRIWETGKSLLTT
jgi:hypothetical protein